MRRRGLGVRARLTAWYAGTLALVVLATALAGRTITRRLLDAQFDASLAGSGALATRFFRSEVAEYRTVEATLAHLGSEFVFPDRRIDFLRPDGTHFTAPGVPRHARPALAPPVRDTLLPLDPDLAPGWTVHVDGSAAAHEALLRRIDLGFLVVFPLLALAGAAGGWWLTGRTLRPVRTMADAAERITASSSADRLPVENPRDELGRLGGTVNALLDRLDGALAQQRRFLADAAHELRTPIARMRATLDLAPATAGAGDQPLRHEVAQLTTLVDELLLLARADAAPVQLALVPQFLDDVIVEALPAWRAAAIRAGVTLEVGAMEEAPARLDAPHVVRLLGVLVDNAIRYTPAGGRVRVSVTGGEAATLVVEDDGIGIAPDERALVTARFFRGAAARQRAPDGSGLGLAIAQWIVARHGGTLAIEPGLAAADRVGTRVVVVLPASLSANRVPARV